MKPYALALMCLAMLSSGCAEGRPKAKYQVGQLVEFVISGNKGQIVQARCNPDYCWYHVRTRGLQVQTNTRLLGTDGPADITPVSLVEYVREFELKLVGRSGP